VIDITAILPQRKTKINRRKVDIFTILAVRKIKSFKCYKEFEQGVDLFTIL